MRILKHLFRVPEVSKNSYENILLYLDKNYNNDHNDTRILYVNYYVIK